VTKHFTGRTAAQVAEALAQLQPLADAGFTLFPLAPRLKVPRDTGWRDADYSTFAPEAWLRQGGNIGVRLTAEQVVVDIDPRNGGDESWDSLSWEAGEDNVVVRTGSGGAHIYFNKPASVRLRGKYPGRPGIDVKGHGGFVVAPGSIHPDTGKPYLIESGSFAAVRPLPGSMLEALRRPELKERSADSGALSPEQLAVLLAVLDPTDFADYDSWLTISAACHDAVDGDPEGMAVWLDWCARDEAYGADAMRANEAKWDTFTAGREGGVTSATLFKAVVDAGHPELVAQLGYDAGEEFEDDIPEQVAEADEADSKRRSRFRRYSVADLIALPPPAWLVDGMVPDGGLVQLYGKRKSNKTFISLDLALCIATGKAFHGVEVKRGRVTYVIGEGGGARFGDRVLAWCQHNGVAPEHLTGHFSVVPVRVAVDNPKDLRDFLTDEDKGNALTVFDTLARSMDGDENSTAEMGLAIKGLDRVREHTGGAVLVVHHSGKDEGKQGRGSTALPGAVDATLKVAKDTAGFTLLQVEEIRDAEEGTKMRFKAVTVPVGNGSRASLAMDLVPERSTAFEPENAVDRVLVRIAERGSVNSREELVDTRTRGMSRANVNKAVVTLVGQGLLDENERRIVATTEGLDRALELGAVIPDEAE
jgi:hypothetical protein